MLFLFLLRRDQVNVCVRYVISYSFNNSFFSFLPSKNHLEVKKGMKGQVVVDFNSRRCLLLLYLLLIFLFYLLNLQFHVCDFHWRREVEGEGEEVREGAEVMIWVQTDVKRRVREEKETCNNNSSRWGERKKVRRWNFFFQEWKKIHRLLLLLSRAETESQVVVSFRQ